MPVPIQHFSIGLMHLRLVIALSIPAVSFAQSTPTRSAEVRQFVSIDSPLLALTHARVSWRLCSGTASAMIRRSCLRQ